MMRSRRIRSATLSAFPHNCRIISVPTATVLLCRAVWVDALKGAPLLGFEADQGGLLLISLDLTGPGRWY